MKIFLRIRQPLLHPTATKQKEDTHNRYILYARFLLFPVAVWIPPWHDEQDQQQRQSQVKQNLSHLFTHTDIRLAANLVRRAMEESKQRQEKEEI